MQGHIAATYNVSICLYLTLDYILYPINYSVKDTGAPLVRITIITTHHMHFPGIHQAVYIVSAVPKTCPKKWKKCKRRSSQEIKESIIQNANYSEMRGGWIFRFFPDSND